MSQDYFSISLPTRCSLYQGVSPELVKIRSLKGRDEKLISELNVDNLEKKFLILLTNVLQGIDPAELTVGDRMYILLWLSVSSYSKDYFIDFTCESCLNKVLNYAVDLSKIKTESLPEGFKEPYAVKLSGGKSINLRLFRVKDEVAIQEYEKMSGNSWTYRYALSIVNEKNAVDNMYFIEELPVADFAKIRVFHEKFYHGPKFEAEFVCPSCSNRGLVPVPFRIELLFPFGETLKRLYGESV